MTKKTVVKRVRLSGNRGVRAHYAVECAQEGRLSYLLCRGFPSIGAHEQVPEHAVEMVCKQCEKSIEKLMRTRGDRFILTTVGGEEHDENREERIGFFVEENEA